jgi:hypothetical protein
MREADSMPFYEAAPLASPAARRPAWTLWLALAIALLIIGLVLTLLLRGS